MDKRNLRKIIEILSITQQILYKKYYILNFLQKLQLAIIQRFFLKVIYSILYRTPSVLCIYLLVIKVIK